MSRDDFSWLMEWYHSHCDGDWEHSEGIKIGTLDNPGWFITVNLSETELQGKEFKTIIVERSETNWYHCFVRDNKFEGRCGPSNLPEVLKIFHDWAIS